MLGHELTAFCFEQCNTYMAYRWEYPYLIIQWWLHINGVHACPNETKKKEKNKVHWSWWLRHQLMKQSFCKELLHEIFVFQFPECRICIIHGIPEAEYE